MTTKDELDNQLDVKIDNMLKIVKRNIAYLKDNPKGYWFKAKLYGWGWTPARWQGWVVLLGFIGLVVLNFYRLDVRSHSASDTVRPFVIQTFIIVLILLYICWKTGERPHWQWGPPDKYR